jgi:hypothetical protein
LFRCVIGLKSDHLWHILRPSQLLMQITSTNDKNEINLNVECGVYQEKMR